jgi:outer membrane protein OmpA-like peptidoglycan-associated protein
MTPMTHSRYAPLRTALFVTVGAAALGLVAERTTFVGQAFAQTDDEKKGRKDDGRAGDKDRGREKGRERQPEGRPPERQQPAPRMERTAPPPDQQPRFRQDGPPPPRDVQRPPRDADPRFKRDDAQRDGPKGPPPDNRGTGFKQEKQDGPPPGDPTPPRMRPTEMPPPRGDGPPKKLESAPMQRDRDGGDRPPAARGPGPEGAPPGLRAGPEPKRFDDIQKNRRERVEDGGRRKVIQEPGNRLIVKEGNRAIIRHDESERFRRRPDAKTSRQPDGSNETYYERRDGSRVFTIVDDNGRLLRRYRRDRDGREHNLIDNRRFYRNLAIGVGVGGIVALTLGMPRVSIPRDRYIVEYDRASDDDIYDALIAPPVDRLDRAYALDEIRYSHELRSYMPRIDLDTITFEFGAWEVPPDQYRRLERIARAMLRVIDRNPDSVFLIEGHTDAVGSDDDNLSLSDRRAGSVANILSDTFEVPPENLVTQGYGEQYLKVNTPGPERLNRRVTVVNITKLMATSER